MWRDGAGIDIGGPRLKTLLALLALRAGSVVQTSELIDGLWGDDVPAGVANALQSLVSRLRAQLAPDAAVEARDGGYALTVDPDQVDAHRFQRLADEGREALEAGRPDDAAGLLADALRLWRGDALAGSGDGTSLRAAAHRLDLERQAATLARIDADLARGRHVAVVAELEGLVAEHPFNEHVRGQLMRALYGSGRQADALSVYENTRRLLREELGADPSPELQRVHIAVLQRSPELDAVRLPRTNLRAQLTSFVGREEDLRRIADLLDSSRLVTLIGPGGAGKTRLAAELGTSVRERFRGAERAMGSDRKRSKTPLLMSSFSAWPVAWLPKITDWARMPGSANVRYAVGDPEIAPPNTNTKSTTKMSGNMTMPTSSNGLVRRRLRLRRVITAAWLSASRMVGRERGVAVAFMRGSSPRIERPARAPNLSCRSGSGRLRPGWAGAG